MNTHDEHLGAEEMRDLGRRVVAGADQLTVRRAKRGQLMAATLGVVLVAGVAGAALSGPLWGAPEVAAPSPSTSQSASATPTPSPTLSPTMNPEPPSFARAQAESDVLPEYVAADDLDRATSRLAGSDETARYFIARGTNADGPYCLILVATDPSPNWVAGCGSLDGVRVSGASIGEAQLSYAGTGPSGWRAIDEFVSVNSGVPRPPVASPTPVETEQPPAYTVANLQSDLNSIGPDIDVGTTPTAEDSAGNALRGTQTEALAVEASARLGAPVALIRPSYVGFPNEQTGSPNSLLWWVVTSQETGLAQSHTHQVGGTDWSGWGQGDRDLAALQSRTTAWLTANYPGQQWIVVTQAH